MFENWNSEFVWPDYNGGCIANIPSTVAQLLEVPFEGLPALRDELWQPVSGDVKRVVVILIDAMGWNIVNKQAASWRDWADSAEINGQMTSVFPSTTVNALSTVWTGNASGQHGLVGLRLFFPEYAALGQMLSLSPEFHRVPDALVKAGLNVTDFLATPGVGTKFAKSDVKTYAFKGNDIVDSALSKMHDRDITKEFGYYTVADMLTQLRELLESSGDDKLYANCYWPMVDTMSHAYGPHSDNVSAETADIFHQIQTILFDQLSAEAREGTVVFITADHGQVETPIDQHVYISEHPELEAMLLMRSAGEPRVAYLYAKQGKVDAVVEYINRELGERAVALSAETALESGLYGPPPFAPKTRERIGDVIVIMKEGALYLNPSDVKRAMRVKARHGGLTADEMQVPWLGFRLG